MIFLVPAGREQSAELLSAAQHEEVFAKLYTASKVVDFPIKTTEAPHYQRYLLQRRARESHGRMNEAEVFARAPKGLGDAKGFVFINHHGGAYPSRYMPLSAGNIMVEPLAELYGKSELFKSLRDSNRLKGKCRRCPLRNACGGSRARAFTMTGDMFAEDPCCAYQP